jgi:hypothetical protein
MPATTRAAAHRMPDVFHGGVLEAIVRQADEPTVLRMTMLNASIRHEMSEPSFKLHTGLCWSVRLDLALLRDEGDTPLFCVGEGRRRQALVLPFMRYAGEVCEKLTVFSHNSGSYSLLMSICNLCPRLKKLHVMNEDHTNDEGVWPSPAARVRAIARACPLLEDVDLSGLSSAHILPHFRNLRVVNMKGEIDLRDDAALATFLKRHAARKDCPGGITLDVNETEWCPSEVLIRAAGGGAGAHITKVTIMECCLHTSATSRLLKACTSLRTLFLWSYMPDRHVNEAVPAADLLRLVTACPSITSLDLAFFVDDDAALLAGLTCLAQLETLKLSGTMYMRSRLSSAGADVLLSRANFPRLVELELEMSHAEGMDMVATLQGIVDARPNLRILQVGHWLFPKELNVETCVLPFEATLESRGGEFRFEPLDEYEP